MAVLAPCAGDCPSDGERWVPGAAAEGDTSGCVSPQTTDCELACSQAPPDAEQEASVHNHWRDNTSKAATEVCGTLLSSVADVLTPVLSASPLLLSLHTAAIATDCGAVGMGLTTADAANGMDGVRAVISDIMPDVSWPGELDIAVTSCALMAAAGAGAGAVVVDAIDAAVTDAADTCPLSTSSSLSSLPLVSSPTTPAADLAAIAAVVASIDVCLHHPRKPRRNALRRSMTSIRDMQCSTYTRSAICFCQCLKLRPTSQR